MTPRLPDGALELEVLAVLWRASGPLTPANVRRHIAHDLAYTTVMTVLGRLHAKGLADRALVGRAFGHTAAVSESELTARKLGTVLATADDRAGALSGFVTHLSAADIAGLRPRRGLAELDPRADRSPTWGGR